MKVIHLTSRADYGGGPEHIYLLIKHLNSLNVQNYIACPNEEPYKYKFESITAREHHFELPHRKFSITSLLHLAKYINKNNIDIIHSHGKGAGSYSRVLKILTGKKVIHTFHGFHIGEYSKLTKKVYCFYESLCSFVTDFAICVSQNELRAISESIRLSRVRVVDNGVNVPNFKNLSKYSNKTVIAVSRFDYQKNTVELIQAAKLIEKIDPEVNFLILGDGHGRSRIEQESQNINNVTFLGNKPNPRQYFRKAHLFVNTSRWEGLPIAPLEAMSEGLPCILSDVVGNNAIKSENYCNVYYQSGDSQGLAQKIINELEDLTLLREKGISARNMVIDKFSAEAMALKTKKIYEDVL